MICWPESEHNIKELAVHLKKKKSSSLDNWYPAKKVVRENSQEISICDLAGVCVQDTMIARIAYQKAVMAGLGLNV